MSTHIIKLYGDIGKYDELSANKLEKLLEAEASYDTLKVRIHSNGGDVFEGWAMYNSFKQLKQRGIRIEFHIDGIAASMMSFIILAGDAIYMAENSMLMIHAPSGVSRGTAKIMKEAAQMLEKVEAIMKEGYVKATGQEEATVADWLSKDTWMTPQEALSHGLINSITSAVLETTVEMSATGSLHPRHAFAAYVEPQASQINSHMKSVFAQLDLNDKASESDVLDKVKALQNSLTEKTGKLTDAQSALAAANSQIDELKASRVEERATLLVEAAVASNKIPEAQKDQFLALAKADYESTKTVLDGMESYTPVTSQLKGLPDQETMAKEWTKRFKEGTLEKLKASNPDYFNALREANLALNK